MDRLSTVQLSRNGTAITPVTTHGYDGLGNLMSQTGAAAWRYGGWESGCDRAAGTHAASSLGTTRYCYDANGNQTQAIYASGSTRTISYTGYDLPEAITMTGTPSTTTIGFKYAPDRSMWKRVDSPTTTLPTSCPNRGDRLACTTTYYAGNVEIRSQRTALSIRRHIGEFLIVTTTIPTGANPAVTTRYDYVLRDGLGSVDVIADAAGTVQQRMGFDAWGQRRNVEVGSGNLWEPMSSALAASFDISRTRQGYTGHEQLDAVGLIHMKGRLYDPVLHRFIQADPFSESHATQGLNRYTYVLNNPLSATDPSGYMSFREVVGLVIVAIASYVSGQYWMVGNYMASLGAIAAGGFLSAYISTGSLKAGMWGAVSEAVGWGLGSAFTSAGWYASTATSGQVAARISTRAVVGGILTDLQDGNFGHGFAAAGVSEMLSPVVSGVEGVGGRIVARAALGGTTSRIAGDTFVNGAISGAFQQAFGEAMGEAPGATSQEEMDARAQEQLTYNRDDAIALNEGNDFYTIRLTNAWASGKLSDNQYAELMCNGCSDPVMQQAAIYSALAVGTFGLGIEAGPVIGGTGRLFFGKGGYFNSGRYLRVGMGREGGQSVVRVAGEWLGKVPSPIRNFLNIREINPGVFKWDLWTRGPL